MRSSYAESAHYDVKGKVMKKAAWPKFCIYNVHKQLGNGQWWIFCTVSPPRGAISTPALLGTWASAHADDAASIRRIGLGCLSTPHSCQGSPSCCRRRQAFPSQFHSAGSRTSRCLILNGAYRRCARDRTPWSASGAVRRLCARVAVGIEQTLRQHFFAL